MAIPLFERAFHFSDRAAVIADGRRYTYEQLLAFSRLVAKKLLAGRTDLDEARIAFLVPPSFEYVALQWGVWRAGGMVVPLCTQHPQPELAHVIDDSQPEAVIAHSEFEDRVRLLAEERSLHFYRTDSLLDNDIQEFGDRLPDIDSSRNAMLVYTSGTTGRPKGVVSTHDNITSQITALVDAWGWTPNDHILEFLPLHHLHGILNVVCCALWSGAICEMMPKFDADKVWQRISEADGLTLFMAVPTVYSRLIKVWLAAGDEAKKRMTEGCKKLRLMVSGSAALPVSILDTWRSISSHTLLERYGMTEIGMALSNPLHGERRPGCVGSPLPRVQIRLVNANGNEVGDGEPGHIHVKGPAVFKEYWRKPQDTSHAFTDDGWFKSGDVATRENNVFRILGRESVDIIKTGGFKVSALEIEEILRTHNAIDECAVVGIDDEEWGQRVAAAVVCVDGVDLDLESLRDWSKQCLAAYKVPTRLLIVPELPRNSLGKVAKSVVISQFEDALYGQVSL